MGFMPELSLKGPQMLRFFVISLTEALSRGTQREGQRERESGGEGEPFRVSTRMKKRRHLKLELKIGSRSEIRRRGGGGGAGSSTRDNQRRKGQIGTGSLGPKP